MKQPIWIEAVFIVKRTLNAKKPNVRIDLSECGFIITTTEKNNKEKCQIDSRMQSGNRPKRTPKEAVIALPPFLFVEKEMHVQRQVRLKPVRTAGS